jgi:GxxExxY protein
VVNSSKIMIDLLDFEVNLIEFAPKNMRATNGYYEPIPYKTEEIGSEIIDCAYRVHKNLGPGLLEKIYETCFCYELDNKGIFFERQLSIPITYDNILFDEGLRVDVYVENAIICELKSAEKINPLWEAQLISYLKLSKTRLGFLINFNVPLIKQGIKRFVL